MKNNNNSTEKSSSQNSQPRKLKSGEYPGLTFQFRSAETSTSSNQSTKSQNTPPISSFKIVKPVIYQEKNWHGAWHGTRPTTRTERKNLRPASSSSNHSSNQAIPTAILIQFSKKSYVQAGNQTFISYDQCILNKDNVSEKENALKNAAEAFDLSSKRPFPS